MNVTKAKTATATGLQGDMMLLTEASKLVNFSFYNAAKLNQIKFKLESCIQVNGLKVVNPIQFR